MDQENRLLNHLDKPMRFLGVNKDEAFAFIGPAMGGFYTGYIVTGVLVATLLLGSYRAFKKKNEGSSLLHTFYWYGPTFKRGMALYVPSHIREYLG